MGSRTKNTTRNMLVALIMQMITTLLSFACRTAFAKLLSAEYLGLSGLFSNLISVLSLSELGIASVIIIHLYKPLAENNEDEICRLMNFYRKAYTAVGFFVIAAGLALTPFLGVLVKSETEIPYLELYFILFVVQSATSYFFAYKQSLLIASQNEYLCTIVRHVFGILMNCLQIAFLLLTRMYVAYLLVSIFTGLGTNLVISYISDKRYPYLRKSKKLKLSREQSREMFSGVSSMMLHKVGNTVITGTDNILISSFIGVVYTGLYSNYLLIMNIISQLITIGLNAVSASIGDFNAKKNIDERHDLFRSMSLMSFWVFGMSAVCFCALFQPTISLWLGDSFLLDYGTVVVISINFLFSGLMRVPSTFADVNGLYTKTKFKPITMALINLALSIVFLKIWGIIGVFIGTLAGYLLIGVWVDPYFLYRFVFNRRCTGYFVWLLMNLAVISVIGIITCTVVVLIPYYILKVAAAVLLSNGLLLLCYFRTREFSYVYTRVKTLFLRKKHNINDWRNENEQLV